MKVSYTKDRLSNIFYFPENRFTKRVLLTRWHEVLKRIEGTYEVMRDSEHINMYTTKICTLSLHCDYAYYRLHKFVYGGKTSMLSLSYMKL